MTEPFNPLAMENIGQSISYAMLETPASSMALLKPFTGAGIYAIYYHGDFPAYQRLAGARVHDHEVPIYVGKAIPSGGRKGVLVETTSRTKALSSRLREHQGSIIDAKNLELEHFTCRWLVIEPIWIPLGENVIISRFTPVWNTVVDGFGNHDPGAGRRAGVRSRWDTLHPGRSWAPNFPPRTEAASNIEQEIEEYLRSRYQT